MSEWVAQPLGCLAAFQKGRKVETSEHPREGFAPYLGASAISGVIEEYGDTRTGVMSSLGDVLMLWDGERSGFVGKAQSGVISSTVARLSPETDIEGEYLYYALDSKFEWIQGRRTGTGVPHVPKDLARILLISYPKSKNEQRRIAKILSTVDEAIEQTKALIAKHQQIKAGLMHDLFTRGVTPDGYLRPTREQAPNLYKESPLGWIPKEWEVTLLSAVMEFLDGKRIPLKEDDRSNMPGQIPYYGASGIIDYIDKWLFDDELILLGEDGENIVSRNLPLAFKVTGKCWVNNHAHVLKPKAGHSTSYWTEQLEWKDYAPLTSGSAQPKITQGKLTNMMVVVPSLAEQEVISKRAECMADHLATEKSLWEKLRLQKHGLMHDLLTGKIRVKIHEQQNTI
ncbi:restriction endonuclease subunit S [Acidithiobacillus sulfuriphilus]|uniref:restriction endonuclease subunit S n=1 Tax=Acidithiobacillus sulfuriphilus TaxID=1867749 RepID=UPI003F61313C